MLREVSWSFWCFIKCFHLEVPKIAEKKMCHPPAGSLDRMSSCETGPKWILDFLRGFKKFQSNIKFHLLHNRGSQKWWKLPGKWWSSIGFLSTPISNETSWVYNLASVSSRVCSCLSGTWRSLHAFRGSALVHAPRFHCVLNLHTLQKNRPAIKPWVKCDQKHDFLAAIHQESGYVLAGFRDRIGNMTAFCVMRHFANENGPHSRVGNDHPWGSREQLRCLLVVQKSSI